MGTKIADVVRNVNIVIEETNFIGQVDEFTPPDLEIKTDEHRGGGMDLDIDLDMGMSKLDANFKFHSVSKMLFQKFGIAAGKLIKAQAYAALVSEDGTKTGLEWHMEGMVKKLAGGTYKAGEKNGSEMDVNLRYYKVVHGGETVIEIDAVNMIRKIGGEDQLEEIRKLIKAG